MSNSICCIFNYAPHYRQAIYKMMDVELSCDFYFGDNVRGDIQKIDYNTFNHPVKEMTTVWYLNRFYRIKGAVSLLFNPYQKYMLTGEIYCISTWIMLLLSKFSAKKVYLWTHGYYGKETKFQLLVKKLYFSLADGVFLYGNYARQLMVKSGLDGEKLHIVYNSLDYEKMKTVRNSLARTSIFKNKFNNSNPVLIFVGRLEKVKKLHFLIQTVHDLHKINKPVNLAFIGDGKEKSNLESLSQQLKISPYVWFYGSCYNESTTGELIYNADLCISPGNVGLTAIHALTYGTPVITHNNFPKQMPEFEAIENTRTGSFFVENDLESMKNEILKWLHEHPHKDDKIIKACYNRIDEYYNPNYQIKVIKNVFIPFSL